MRGIDQPVLNLVYTRLTCDSLCALGPVVEGSCQQTAVGFIPVSRAGENIGQVSNTPPNGTTFHTGQTCFLVLTFGITVG